MNVYYSYNLVVAYYMLTKGRPAGVPLNIVIILLFYYAVILLSLI